MSRTTQRGVLGSLVILSAVVTLPLMAACVPLPPEPVPLATNAASRVAPAPNAVAQIRHSDGTAFELCRPDTCLRPTPKTRVKVAQATDATSLTPAAGTSPYPPVIGVPAAPPARVDPDVGAGPEAQRTAVVTFAPGSAQLTPATKQRLADLLPEIRQARLLELRGRTDDRGSLTLNDALAQQRAVAVQDHLRALQLSAATRIALSAQGRCCYVAENRTSAGRAANRRVEIAYRAPLQLVQRTARDEN